MMNPLLDKDFLKALDEHKERETYAKIIALTFQEDPIEEISGRVTGGSVSINGTSAVRRTCSLNLLAQELNINDYYWGEKSKFRLFIGLENKIDPRYPEIIWFPQGTFVISSFSSSLAVGGFDVSIQGRDKMCLLNGEIGGMVHSLTADFGSYDQIDKDGNVENISMIIRDIIKSIVHEYGKEPYHNIVINDLEDTGVELMEYRGDRPLYFLVDWALDEVTNMILEGSQEYQIVNTKDASGVVTSVKEDTITLETIPADLYDLRANLDRDGVSREDPLLVTPIGPALGDPLKKAYSVMKIEYGETVGYRITDLTYAGDLIANVGESVTTVLDKITNMLGEFEYYYDVNGRFIFQKKPTHVYTSWNNITNIEDEEFVDNAAFSSACQYHFESNNLISAFSNNPDLANVRNDFSIWGSRKGVSGAEIPVHLRYAIDKKPVYYKNFEGQIFVSTQSLYDELKQKFRDVVEKEVQKELDDFNPSHMDDNILAGLQKPEKQENGSWSAGWWDIRDWYDYYVSLTGNIPRGTMKWYSHNSIDGCVPINTLPGFEENLTGNYVWLIIVDPDTGAINTQHGAGNPEGTPRISYYNESYIGEDGKLKTSRVDPAVTKYFIPPFSVCTDSHTYLQFLTDDIETDGNYVYFYNPNFPGQGGFDAEYNQKIENTVKQRYIDTCLLNLVDWREVIYQMALDYYKHSQYSSDAEVIRNRMRKVNFNAGTHEYTPNFYYYTVSTSNGYDYQLETEATPREGVQYYTLINGDNFLSEIRKNNVEYYPTGYTGYEHYYQDLQGFWRQLYNPWPEHQTEESSAITLATEDTSPSEVLIKNGFRPYQKYLIDERQTSLEITKELYYSLLEYDARYADENIGIIKMTELVEKDKNNKTQYKYEIKDQESLQALINQKIPGKDHELSNRNIYVYQSADNVMAKLYDTLDLATIFKNSYSNENGPSLYYYDDSQTAESNEYDFPYFKIIKDKTIADPTKESHSLCEISHLPNYIEKCDLFLRYADADSERDVTQQLNENEVNRLNAKAAALQPDVYDTPGELEAALLKIDRDYDDIAKRIRKTLKVEWKNWYDEYWKTTWEDTKKWQAEAYVKDGDGSVIEYSSLPDLIKPLYYNETTGYQENVLVRDYDRMGKPLVTTQTEISYDEDGKPKYQYKLDKDGNKILVSGTTDQYKQELVLITTSTPSFTKSPNKFYRYYYEYDLGEGANLFWNKNINLAPENLNFWFDFLDIVGGELAQFAVNVIGDRPKAVNDSSVKAIYFRETPTIIFVNADEWDLPRDEKPGYTYINLPSELEGLFTISAQGKSAKDMLDNFIYSYAYCAESISITSLPIYYLEPNTRIFVRDDKTKINGEYIISSISLPLTYNGTMSISATKATENIY